MIFSFPVPTLLLYSVAIAAVLVYLPFLLVGWARVQVGYDIANPRLMFDKLPPYAQRATWAHQNSFESIALFAPAAILAYVTGQDSQTAGIAAIAYLVARLLFSAFYIFNVPLLRSLMFAVASASTATLFWLSLTNR